MFNIISTDLIFGTKYWPTIWKYATDSESLIAKSVTNPKDMVSIFEFHFTVVKASITFTRMLYCIPVIIFCI